MKTVLSIIVSLVAVAAFANEPATAQVKAEAAKVQQA